VAKGRNIIRKNIGNSEKKERKSEPQKRGGNSQGGRTGMERPGEEKMYKQGGGVSGVIVVPEGT